MERLFQKDTWVELMRGTYLTKNSGVLVKISFGVFHMAAFFILQILLAGKLSSHFDDEIEFAPLEESFAQFLCFGKGTTSVALFLLAPTASRSSYFRPSPLGIQSQLVRGCPQIGTSSFDRLLSSEPISEWDEELNYDKAIATYGVVPIACYGKKSFANRVFGIALSERRIYLAKRSLLEGSGEGDLVSVPTEMNDGFFVNLPINDIECKIKLDLSLRHSFRMNRQKAKELFKNTFVVLNQDLVRCARVNFHGIEVNGVTIQLHDEPEEVCAGFDLIRRIRSELDFTKDSDLRTAIWRIDRSLCADVSSQLFKGDFDSSMNEYGMHVLEVFDWGLLRNKLLKDDFLIAVNGVNIARFPKCVLEELIAKSVLKGGVFRVLRGQDEMDVNMLPQPERLKARNQYFDGVNLN